MKLVTVIGEVKDYFAAMLICIAFAVGAVVVMGLLVAPIFVFPVLHDWSDIVWTIPPRIPIFAGDECGPCAVSIVVCGLLWAFTLSYLLERATRPPKINIWGREREALD